MIAGVVAVIEILRVSISRRIINEWGNYTAGSINPKKVERLQQQFQHAENLYPFHIAA
jgi:hypothetical protein